MPTLVTHDVDDAVVRVAAGRWLAEQIPGAIFTETPGGDHITLAGPEWRTVTDLHLEFICGSVTPARSERTLATVVFTDIVGSTARTASDGDERWRRTLDSHDRVAWAMVNRHRGVMVKATGDGLLLRFDSPSPALDFAPRLRREVSNMGVPIRCGLHMGEIEVRTDGDIAGVAVNIAKRVEEAAVDGEIFVSSTVRDLMLGGDARVRRPGRAHAQGLRLALASLLVGRLRVQSSGRRAMIAGPPAKTQPAAKATSGVPTATTARWPIGRRRQVAEPTRGECDVGTRDAEHRAESGDRARGDRADAATCRRCRTGRGERAELTSGLAADEAHGHREDDEREQHPCRDHAEPEVREPRLVVAALDLDAVLRRDDRAAFSWLVDSGVGVSINH